MDDIIGFLVFVFIMAVSIIGKIRSGRNPEEEQEDKADRPLTLDRLPESTRRMLFGDGEIIVAKPKQPLPQTNAPRPPAEVASAPVPGRQVILERSNPMEVPQPFREQRGRPAAPLERQAQAEPHVPRPQAQPRAPRMQPQAQAPRMQPQAQAPRTQPHHAPQGAGRQPVQQQPRPQAQPARTARPPESPERALARQRQRVLNSMSTKQGLANAVLLREILGPPRSLEPWTY